MWCIMDDNDMREDMQGRVMATILNLVDHPLTCELASSTIVQTGCMFCKETRISSAPIHVANAFPNLQVTTNISIIAVSGCSKDMSICKEFNVDFNRSCFFLLKLEFNHSRQLVRVPCTI